MARFPQCDPDKAGQYLCDELGQRLTSAVGYSLVYNNTNGIRPTRGQSVVVSQDFAGLGGDVKYIRTRLTGTNIISRRSSAVAGYFRPAPRVAISIRWRKRLRPGSDPIRITDRFFGTAAARLRYSRHRPARSPRGIMMTTASASHRSQPSKRRSGRPGLLHGPGRARVPDQLGVEELRPAPVGLHRRRIGVGPHASPAVDWHHSHGFCSPPTGVDRHRGYARSDASPSAGCATGLRSLQAIRERFVGNSPKPRLAIGVGVNWVSPFGPLRIDLAKAILKQEGDETKLFSFNVGTQF